MTIKSGFAPAHPFAQFLGLDTAPSPKRTASAAVRPSTRPMATRSAPSPIRSSATSAPAAHSAPKKQPRAQTATPFADFLGSYEAVAANNRQTSEQTLCVPTMSSGFSDGHYFTVSRPAPAAAPRIDASSVAARVIAAGERALRG